MGIDISAALIVGREYEDIEDVVGHHIEQQDSDDYCGYDVIEDWEFDIASPYYDAGYENSIIGVTIGVVNDENILAAKIKAAKEEFFQKTGVEAEVFITPNVY